MITYCFLLASSLHFRIYLNKFNQINKNVIHNHKVDKQDQIKYIFLNSNCNDQSDHREEDIIFFQFKIQHVGKRILCNKSLKSQLKETLQNIN